MGKDELKEAFIFRNWTILCLASFIIWTLVFIQVFYGDVIGNLINSIVPNSDWIENYRFFLFILTIGIIAVFAGFKSVLIIFFFVIAYPLVLFLWIIPKLIIWKIPKLLQNRNSGFGLYFFINQVFNFFLKIKSHIICGSLFFLTIGIIFNSSNSNSLYFAIFTLLILLSWHLLNRLLIAINAEALVSIDIPKIPKDKIKIELSEDITSDQPSVKKIIAQSRQQNVFKYKALKYVNEKAQLIKKDKNYVIILLFRVFVSYVICVSSLTLINFTLYLADTSSFSVTETISLFDSFYYTFKSMYGSEVTFMLPTSNFTRAISVLAPLCSGFIFFFIVTIFFSIHSDKYSEKLDEAINTSQSLLTEMEIDFENVYLITLDSAYLITKKDRTSFVFLFLRYFIGQAEEDIMGLD